MLNPQQLKYWRVKLFSSELLFGHNYCQNYWTIFTTIVRTVELSPQPWNYCHNSCHNYCQNPTTGKRNPTHPDCSYSSSSKLFVQQQCQFKGFGQHRHQILIWHLEHSNPWQSVCLCELRERPNISIEESCKVTSPGVFPCCHSVTLKLCICICMCIWCCPIYWWL